ncbi:unnamed protein product [Aphanomyces euteiches]|uniref:Uncharacterized protein n=1 Tax=Aphanomyces euteiches TaxID=100861 RepID=A0A6G0WRH6_9STRA|nr:hypothetical protein Ae201684_012495 [Aphanomyces euteiches]KAH9090610.1 hypothetical protein Ae201684P_014406 [Aphanomyces euteiches]KAH9110713.1 hypothetical protein LEN26_013655 [Aphanomyces euteiches]KAH9114602.1 hypothetical protein AeMF1_011309 [Aphanomyces euteiches]KAH9134340.1 hypothetical protein AeRB84_019793 [Aphanomyces euteiches]
MGASTAELSPLMESSPATSTSSSSTFDAVIVPVIKSTRSIHVQTKPKEEVYPLPWFRSPEMPKKPVRLILKKESPKTICCNITRLNDGEKCIHVLVAAILVCTIVVILSIIYHSGKQAPKNTLHPHFILRGNS